MTSVDSAEPALDAVPTDPYAATASHFDLAVHDFWPVRSEALRVLVSRVPADAGALLDVGAGTAMVTAALLELLPGTDVLALEPSPMMRAAALSRIAAHPPWWSRVTLRPEALHDAPLPDRLCAAVMIGVLGHLTPQQRTTALALLAARLPSGGPVLLDLQKPAPPVRVPSTVVATTTVGALSYRTSMEAWPQGGDLSRWRMTYQVLDGDAVVDEQVTVHDYHHPRAEVVADEAAAAGFAMTPLESAPTFHLLTRS